MPELSATWVQNHLMQLLCLAVMEPMVSFDADQIRNKKVDVLHAIRPINCDEVHHFVVRGQYHPGVGERREGSWLPRGRRRRAQFPNRDLCRPQVIRG